MNVTQFANFSRNILRNKIVKLLRGKYCGENFAEIFVAENCFSTDNLLKYKQLNTACNNGLHQLLGLRLLFCSSWKIIWWLQLYLSKKICRFVWFVIAAATDAKHGNVTGQLCRNYAGNFDLKMKFVTRREFTKQKRENWNRQQK